MRKTATIIGIVLLVAALAVPAFSGGRGWERDSHKPGNWHGYPGYHRQYDRGYENLTEEQRNQLDRLHQKFYDENAQLRNEILTKSGELNILLNSPSPDAEKAKALQKEISEMKAKMAQNRVDFQLEARKIAPEIFLGRGYAGAPHPPMRGRGPGIGYGPKTGYGPGCRW